MRAEGNQAEEAAQRLEQLAALDRVMAIAEFDVTGVLRQANERYLALLGCSREQALGQHHRNFCPPGVADTPEYRALWTRLARGDSHSGLIERVRRDGSSCWLEASYTPIHDPKGQVLRVLKVASDVSERLRQEHSQQEHLRRLSLVADASDAAVVISDANSRIIYVNAGFSRMFGWTQPEVLGREPIALLAPQLPQTFAEDYRDGLRAGRAVGREEIVSGREGQRYWAKVISNPVAGPDGAWQYTVTLLTDITRAKMHEALQHRVLEAMARERPLVEVMELICREVERIAPDLIASILEVDEQGLLHPLASPGLPMEYSSKLEGLAIGPKVGSCGTAAWRRESVMVGDMDHDPLWADYHALFQPQGLKACWSTPFFNGEGRVIGTFAFYSRRKHSDLNSPFHQQMVDACTHLCSLALERELARKRIRQLAFYDGLTGLPNRSLLHARADQAIASAARHEQQLAVLFLDLDRFKQVNDSLGHPAGDALLREVAKRLQHELRASDIAGRLSGDEFVVVLPECDAEHATNTVERLQALLAEPVNIAGTRLSISASVGIAIFPGDGREVEALLQRADMAMYQAKSAERGSFRFFSAEMNRMAQERLALETALREALARGSLHLHYQPQIELATGRLYGVEALARWTHAELGPIPPTRFIPLAEECGLITELGRWALREACRQLAAWRAQGLNVPAVAVNLSPTAFHNLELPTIIASALERHALQASDLTLEITESVLLDTNPSTMKTIAEVHAQGVRLSMDDFGTGYSSLSYLRRLPVSELKLDRIFVADLEGDETARALSDAILGIGKSLQLTVVAEGVENEQQNRLLHEQGYPVAQGYLFSRPLSPQDLEPWLRQTLGRA